MEKSAFELIVNKRCIYLVRSDYKKGYCLKLKIWIRELNPCPIRCSYFVRGGGGNMKEVEKKTYDISCIYFTRQLNESGAPVYYCNLYVQEEPYCRMCPFGKYYPLQFDTP